MLEPIVQDLRHAARSLRRTPAFALTAIATLTIAIGAATAIASVIDAVLLRPLPYREPERLIGAWHDFPPIHLLHGGQAAITYWAYQSQARSIQGIGIYKEGAVNLADDPAQARETVAPRRVTSAAMSASMFNVLGVAASRGRVFGTADDRAGAPPVVVLSDALWRAEFGMDSTVIGRFIDVNGVRREVVGVMRAEFRFPSAETSLWIPLALDPAHPPADAFAYTAVARLNPGVSLAGAQQDFADVLRRVPDLYPTFVPGISTRQIMDQTKPHPVLTPFQEDVTGGVATTLEIIAAAAALLLLVACFNVANLTLVRFDARQRELAVREALGGGRGRIARLYWCESALIAAAAGALGFGLATVTVDALVMTAPAGLPRLAEIGVDAAVVAWTTSLAIFAATLCALIPTWRVMRGTVMLRESARGGTATRAQHRVRSALVAAQFALTLTVLAASGLLLRSFQRLHAVRLGYDPEHVTTFWLSLPRGRYAKDRDVVRFYSQLAQRVAQLPGVSSVGVSGLVPLVARGVSPNPLYPEDQPQFATSLPPLQLFTAVSADYFRTMRIPLLAGTSFVSMETQRDGEAIISRATATFFWHDSTGRAAIGKRFRALPTDPWYTVIGVVGDIHDTTLTAAPSSTVYYPEVEHTLPGGSHLGRTMALVVRTAGDDATLAGSVQRIVSGVDPTLPTFDVRSMSDVVKASTARLAFTILMLGGAAVVTLLLGAVGLYGLLAYMVALRRREIGIRIALGASPNSVAMATTRHAVALALAGVAGGLLVFAASTRFVKAFVFGVTAWDPVALAASIVVLLLMAGAASWVPARRASLVDPTLTLREE